MNYYFHTKGNCPIEDERIANICNTFFIEGTFCGWDEDKQLIATDMGAFGKFVRSRIARCHWTYKQMPDPYAGKKTYLELADVFFSSCEEEKLAIRDYVRYIARNCTAYSLTDMGLQHLEKYLSDVSIGAVKVAKKENTLSFSFLADRQGYVVAEGVREWMTYHHPKVKFSIMYR